MAVPHFFFFTRNILKYFCFEHLKIKFWTSWNKSKEQINSILKFILAFLNKRKNPISNQFDLKLGEKK